MPLQEFTNSFISLQAFPDSFEPDKVERHSTAKSLLLDDSALALVVSNPCWSIVQTFYIVLSIK